MPAAEAGELMPQGQRDDPEMSKDTGVQPGADEQVAKR
jgi:hypothetical protein